MHVLHCLSKITVLFNLDHILKLWQSTLCRALKKREVVTKSKNGSWETYCQFAVHSGPAVPPLGSVCDPGVEVGVLNLLLEGKEDVLTLPHTQG